MQKNLGDHDPLSHNKGLQLIDTLILIFTYYLYNDL